ncbi:MAG: type II secretion system F family protein, partial [Candidatus Magasanikbacteria bacterium]|nr:type II secretion system F family protein [Candidatus Magasanikbacteria bacterium]
MKYKYSARTEAGELQAGYVEASNQEAALNILKNNNLFILAMEATEGGGWYKGIVRFFRRVKVKDLMIFTRQFAILLEAHVPISDTLRTLHRQTEKTVLRNALLEVSEDVDAGLSLSQAMERQREIFSEFYISMIRPAELTGRLEKAMSFLADYLEKEALRISRIRNALIYPTVVLVLFAVVMIVMLVTVFPQIEPVFRDSGVSLPLITTIFLTFGNFVIRWWLAVIIILILFGILVADYLSSVEGKLVLNELKIRLPVFGGL